MKVLFLMQNVYGSKVYRTKHLREKKSNGTKRLKDKMCNGTN
jgi:translation elongation factor EF-4